MRKSVIALLLLATTLPAFAVQLATSQAWVRLLPGDLPLAGYVQLKNNSPHDVTLVSASSPAFASVQFHRSMHHSGMDGMKHLSSLRIGAGQTLELAPGGYHLMLMGRKQALKPGEQISIIFKFEDGSQQTVEFLVKGATGS